MLVFALPLKVSPKHSPQFPWNLEKQTASDQRRAAWRKRGGFVVEFARKVRRKIREFSSNA